ncbi:MAG TPA: hypothetical protein VFN78_14345 [Ktedonobacterales bacterium]|nr:hypothetical protein [Ktedonobacterales bacterium]
MDRQGNPAVKWGLIFGGALILVAVINFAIQYATGALNTATSAPSLGTPRLGASLAQGCVVFLIEVALYFLAGMMTARDNGRVGSAAIAGVIAGAMAGVVGAIIAVFTIATRASAVMPPNVNMTPAAYHSFVVTVGIIGAVVGLLIAIGIGAGIAALGGLVGRNQFARAHPAQPMLESYYTPVAPPPPGYPAHPQGYPPAPGAYPPPYPSQYPPQSPPQQYPPQDAAPYPPQEAPQNPPQYPPQYPPQQ